jgi:hypothetical protein
MKFIKVVIDGKEYYERVENEDTCAAEENEDFIDVEIGEAQEPSKREKFRRDTEEFFDKFGAGARELGEKFVVGARELGEKIKVGTERLFSTDKSEDPESREAKLIKILPYLSAEEAHNVCLEIMADEKLLSELEIASIMPSLATEDCDTLFIRALEIGMDEDLLVPAVKYISQACADKVTDDYISGKYPSLNMDKFYPHLSDENIKKLFYHIIGK